MSVQMVKQYVSGRLRRLRSLPEHPQKAALATMRKGIGHAPGELPELWGEFLLDLPEEMQSKNGDPTKEEWAIYLALTMYALHQQGHSMATENMHRDQERFGHAVRRLIPANENVADSSVLRRFNVLATATDIREVSRHLCSMIQLLRTRGIPLDYVQLAGDLYEWQFAEGVPRVRLRWGQDFYRNEGNAMQENGKEEKNEK